MTTVFTRCRNPGWLMALGLAIFAFAPGTASANLSDPSTLQIGPGTTTDPVQIVGGTSPVTVFQNQGGASDLEVPWLLILGIPNTTSTNAQITLINGSATGTPVTGTLGGTMTSTPPVNPSPPPPNLSNDAYTILGLAGANNSNNFVNWSTADSTINGITATSFGLFEYNIPVTLSAKGTDSFVFANLPQGTFVIAYGTDAGTVYDTPFTQAGLTTTGIPPGAPVPEPSTMVIAALGALGFVGYGLRRHPKK